MDKEYAIGVWLKDGRLFECTKKNKKDIKDILLLLTLLDVPLSSIQVSKYNNKGNYWEACEDEFISSGGILDS